ncbi:membrane cofactor protein isoform X4 [Pteropus medius]|uniref:membrane cofactor protein isoform X4 n=1 Tax=Pteropus vampyrus TaxID=132908 RepID=UPI00196AC688|nr:membrane cofactor protein isoform X4 [Pteropus giganteus]
MTASYGTRTTPPRCHKNLFHSCRFVGIFLMTLVILLPTSSDACDDPPRYESMMLKDVSKDLYHPGDQIEFKCRLGFKPIVPLLPTTAICQANNTWTPLQEACTRKSCPQLADPSNGQVNGTFLFGSEVHFVCNEGYELVGAKILYCEISENTVAWSGDPPQCEKIMCQPPGDIPNGKHTSSHKDVFEYNEVVIYSCNPSGGPDEYSLVGESRLVCSGRGTWSSALPECKVVKCQYPVVKNGRLIAGFARKFYYNAQVVFECVQGFHLKGNSTIVCGANNEWQPKMPECIEVLTPSSTKHPILNHSVSTPLSTKSPVSSVTVSTPLSTKSPISSVTDVKPATIPVTPSVAGHPGSVTLPGLKPTSPATSPVPRPTGSEHATPGDEPPKYLGGGIIVLIVIVIVVGVALICCIVWIVLHRKKKREREVSAAYSAYQNKSSTPAEQTN